MNYSFTIERTVQEDVEHGENNEKVLASEDSGLHANHFAVLLIFVVSVDK